jgi:NADP-dependent 3-hydroxy acid dehydrogenase YdfG
MPGLEDWRDAVEVNLMGVVHGVQAAWPRLVEQGFGLSRREYAKVRPLIGK